MSVFHSELIHRRGHVHKCVAHPRGVVLSRNVASAVNYIHTTCLLDLAPKMNQVDLYS